MLNNAPFRAGHSTTIFSIDFHQALNIEVNIDKQLIYFLLYQTNLFANFDIIISYALILGCSCILFLIIFSCSKAYASILLNKKLKYVNLTIEEQVEYYFEKSFIITTIFQMILSIFLLVTYYYNNPSNIVIKQLKELSILIIIIIIFILLSIIIWFILLKQYIEKLEMKVRNLDIRKTETSTSKDNQSLYRNRVKIIINVDFNEKENHDE